MDNNAVYTDNDIRILTAVIKPNLNNILYRSTNKNKLLAYKKKITIDLILLPPSELRSKLKALRAFLMLGLVQQVCASFLSVAHMFTGNILFRDIAEFREKNILTTKKNKNDNNKNTKNSWWFFCARKQQI